MRTIYLAREIWELHTRSYYALRKARTAADAERQRLRDAREAARTRAIEHAKTGEATEQADEAAELANHESKLAELDSTVQKADEIMETIDQRGGIEPAAPVFGRADLASEAPSLMAEEDAAAAKRASRSRTAKAAADAA